MTQGTNGGSGGQGHPLPDSTDAREDELPEHMLRDKGHGGKSAGPAAAPKQAVAPDGTPYPTAHDADVAH